MTIENIQYVYDHTRLYRRALRPLNNQFFYGYKKNNKERTKNSIETCEKTLSKPYSHIWPLKICSIEPSLNTKKCGIGLLIKK